MIVLTQLIIDTKKLIREKIPPNTIPKANLKLTNEEAIAMTII